MKTLSGMLKKKLATVPDDSDRPCTHVLGEKSIHRLDKMTMVKDMTCPICQGCEGFRFLVDHEHWTWGCNAESCHPKLQRYDWTICGRGALERMEKDKKLMPHFSASRLFDVPDIMEDVSFETKGHPPEMIGILKEWALAPTYNLVLHGLPGRGKTHLACAMLNFYGFGGGKGAKFVNVARFHQQWKEAQTKEQSIGDLLNSYVNCHILVLDDLGMTKPSEAFLSSLYYIIDGRMMRNKGTLITTNLEPDQVAGTLGEAMESRLLSGRIICITGPDRRNKANNFHLVKG